MNTEKNKTIINIIDITISFILIIIFFPVLIFICLLIFIINGKPILHLSERVGLNNKIFILLKFRTMKVKKFQNQKDKVTKLGKFLRKSSIDEIPQLLNILKGDMSLVGPRPLPKTLVKNINFKRHTVKPGLTGLSQIMYEGKKRSLNEKLKLDKKFIKNYGLKIYLTILTKTPLVLLKRYKFNQSGKTL